MPTKAAAPTGIAAAFAASLVAFVIFRPSLIVAVPRSSSSSIVARLPANVEIPGTDVAASTLHSLFDLDIELKSKLDFSKLDHEKVKLLVKLEVLLLDEVSMREPSGHTVTDHIHSCARRRQH
jgi:hypothetical protein